MHEYAEHGHAAHWLYKENVNWVPSVSGVDECESSYLARDVDDQDSAEDQEGLFQKYSSLKAGHPVLRVEGSHLLAAVIIRYNLVEFANTFCDIQTLDILVKFLFH